MEMENYLPKKIKEQIVNITVESDFDYNKNRSVQHYFVTLKDGISFDATSINELKKKAKQIKK